MTPKTVSTRFPFLTLMKIGMIGVYTLVFLLVLFTGILQLFNAIPASDYSGAPIFVQIVVWVFGLIVGPIFASLAFACSCWLGVSVLLRFKLVQLHVEIAHSDEQAA